MAVEEAEYYTLHQGNGVSGGVRSSRNKPSSRKTKAEPGSGGGLTSFLQGITLGTVLLIPVGVWCWVRVDDAAPRPATQEPSSRPTARKGKQAAPSSKRKPPMRPGAAVAPQWQPRVTEVDTMKSKSLVEPRQPPSMIESPVPAPIPARNEVPRVAEEEPSDNNPEKPKKGIWRTLASPFKGKSKDGPPSPPSNVPDWQQ